MADCVKAGLEPTKRWPIRTQVLRTELGALVVVLLVINFFVVFDILYIRRSTLAEVRSRANATTEQNLLQLADILAKVINAYLESSLLLLGTVQTALQELENSPLAQIPSMTYQQLPGSCMQYNETLYGNLPVCVKQSSFKPLGFVNNVVLQQSAQLDYIFPALAGLSAAGTNMLRVQLYFNTSNFLRIFPGTHVNSTFRPDNQPWFQALQKNGYRPTLTGVYADTLGGGQEIFSVAVPLWLHGEGAGAMCLDIQASAAMGVLKDAAFSESGEVSIVGRDLQPFPNPDGLNHTVSRSLLDVKPGEVVHFEGKRTVVARIPDTDDWGALLVVTVPNSVGTGYVNLEADEVDSAAGWLLVISVFSSLLVLGAVGLCLCFYTRRLTSPLHGVIRFAQGLHQTATSRHAVKQEDLDLLEEGEDNVQHLVQVFKKLATQLVSQNCQVPRRSVLRSRFPVNELQGKAPWRKALRLVS